MEETVDRVDIVVLAKVFDKDASQVGAETVGASTSKLG